MRNRPDLADRPAPPRLPGLPGLSISRSWRWSALAFAVLSSCLLLSACREKHEPLKPTVLQPVVPALTQPLVQTSAAPAPGGR